MIRSVKNYLLLAKFFGIGLGRISRVTLIGLLVGVLDLSVGLMLVSVSDFEKTSSGDLLPFHLGIMILGALILRSILGYVMQKWIAILGQNVARDIVSSLNGVFLRLPIRKLLKQDYGYLLNASTNWANLIGGNLISPMIAILTDAVFLVLLVSLLTLILGKNVLVICIFSSAIAYLIYKISANRVANAGIVGVESGKQLYSLINSSLSGAREVRQFNLEFRILDEINRLAKVQADAHSKKNYLASIPRLVIEGIGSLLVVAISLKSSGPSNASLPSMTLFAFFLIRFLPLAGRLAANVNSLKFADPVIKPIIEICNLGSEPGQNVDRGTDQIQVNQIDSFSISDFSFGYPNSLFGESLNKQFNLGSICALTGASGSGKSTFLDCISGFQSKITGSVSYKVGNEVFAVDNLSKMSVLVSQHTHLFPGTLAWNLHFKDEVSISSKDRCMELFKRVGLPLAYLESNSLVGSSSSGFSGGELQRISLVRAILQDKPILLLDEVTSGLDDHTKELVMSLLSELSATKVIIMATHDEDMIRLATDFLKLEKNSK
jgi:ABC-type multidrug transport system fused ATPase/permease subunit